MRLDQVFRTKVVVGVLAAPKTGIAKVDGHARTMVLVEVWETVVSAGALNAVDLVGWQVVARPIAPVLGEPESAGHRMPGHAHGIAYTVGVDGGGSGVGVHSQDGGETLVVASLADVAWRANWNIQIAVRTENEVLPAVIRLARQIVRNHFRVGTVPERIHDVGIAQHLVQRSDVEIITAQRDTTRAVKRRIHGHHFHAAIVTRGDCIHVRGSAAIRGRADEHGADEQRAVRCFGDLPRSGYVVRHRLQREPVLEVGGLALGVSPRRTRGLEPAIRRFASYRSAWHTHLDRGGLNIPRGSLGNNAANAAPSTRLQCPHARR